MQYLAYCSASSASVEKVIHGTSQRVDVEVELGEKVLCITFCRVVEVLVCPTSVNRLVSLVFPY